MVRLSTVEHPEYPSLTCPRAAGGKPYPFFLLTSLLGWPNARHHITGLHTDIGKEGVFMVASDPSSGRCWRERRVGAILKPGVGASPEPGPVSMEAFGNLVIRQRTGGQRDWISTGWLL